MTILLRLLLVTCALISPALLRAGKQDETNPWIKPGTPPPLLPGKGLTVSCPDPLPPLPDNTVKLESAKVSFQIHYTPSGVAKKERLKMGVVFAKQPPTYEVRTAPLANKRLAIPPGAPRHLETHSQRVPFDMPITGFMPHMHTRGAGFRYEVTYPDGKNEVLLDIPRYDFNWQLRYELKQPKLIPKGSTLKITAAFDNSTGNKANPDPTKLVKWGSQTVDEMMIGYVEYFRPLSP